ncbi:acyl-CoA dehydrogenase family protein [Paraburkholderia sp. J67]|uniref:acyl-CoA dehydrogenase family protein n=1 Tax=Paraburkholderia sp. J67 TaxID=2805435 RepID=UPI002ABDA7E0|nr:acyl-CoA dehydrogenase family protein [Paraburkholderia sp. J67]
MTVISEGRLRPATLIQAAVDLAPLAREYAQQADTSRRIPDALIAAFREAGLFTAMRPAEVGGAAIRFGEFIDIVRHISRGDASAGWVAAFLISHEWLLSRLNAQAQAEIFADGFGLAAAAAAPPGKAEAVDGGYRVTGRWRFASAILHSNWVVVSAGGPATGPLAVVARIGEGTIHDTWHVPGMRGTGSNDFELKDAFIPAHRVVDFVRYSSRENDGAQLFPSYEALQYPMYRVLSLIHGAVAVGTAEAALELYPSIIGNRVRPATGQPLAEEAGNHSAYGEAVQQAQIARLLLDDAVARTERLYARGSENPSLEERARLNLAVTGSGTEALKAVDTLVQNAGASIHRDGHPLDLINRNSQVMRSHAVLDWRYAQSLAGRVLLGQGPGKHLDALY